MNNIFTYLIELNIAITVFYMIYLAIFKKDANFNNRRAFLLFAMGMSFLVPLINIQFTNPVTTMNSAIVNLEEYIIIAGSETNEKSQISFIQLLGSVYLLVSLFFLGKMFVSIGKIVFQMKRSKKSQIDGIKVRHNVPLHASSFFSVIFIDPEMANDKNLKHILEHETYHARLMHSVDRILSEILLSISWFNPITWMLRKAIIVNHEYQADNRVIERGTDHVSYQITILNQYIGSASISNQFSNQIKNRIKMLNKNYKKGSSWKSLFLLPISIILLFFMACGNESGVDDEITDTLKAEQVEKSAEDQIFYVVEEMPKWADGDEDIATHIRKVIAQNLAYPEAAELAGVEGKVFIHFLVTKTGDIMVPDPSMLPPAKDDAGNLEEVVVVSYRTLNSEQKMPNDKMIQLFKDESKRVIELVPDVIPGKQRGKAVNVIYTMPITFKLK
jgi:beta-lactamase regulating signal transducer with metallopeptidase domain